MKSSTSPGGDAREGIPTRSSKRHEIAARLCRFEQLGIRGEMPESGAMRMRRAPERPQPQE
jgi:hypothetical protein